MGKRRKQATLQVAATGRVHLTGQPARERSLSPGEQARADRQQRAQRSLAKHHQPTWTELQEQGRIDEHGETVTSSDDDNPKGLVEQLQLVPQSTTSDDDGDDDNDEDDKEDDGFAGVQEEADPKRQTDGHRAAQKRSTDTDDEDDEGPLPTPRCRHVKTIVLSSSGEEADEEVEVQQPVASTSKAALGEASAKIDGRRNVTPPPRKRQRSTSVFEGVVIDSPVRRRAPTAAAATKKGGRIEAIIEEREATQMSEDDLPAPRLNSSARKRLLIASSSSSSAEEGSPARRRNATASTSSDEDLPVPAAIATDNKRLKAQREARLNNAALRDPRKKDKRRKIDTKRRLTALSQGARDRRSADEDSGEEDFVVEDDDEIVYDTPSGEEDDDSEPVAPRMSAKKRGKQRAVSDDEEEAGPRRKPNGETKKRLHGGKSRSQVQRELLASSSDEAEEAAEKNKKKRKKGKGRERSASQDAEGRRKRRRRRRRKSASGSGASPSGSDADVDDEPEDLEILDEETVLEEKFRSRVKDDKFAALKATRERKKSRQAIVIDSEDEDVRPTQKATAHSASQPRFLGDPDHRSSEEEEASEGDGSGSGSGSGSTSETNTADSDAAFIVEDDGNDAEVAKFRAGLQLKLQGMRHHYKTYILFLIYQIIDPDHDWRADDDELKEADQRVTAALKSTISSVGSSAWKPRFLKAINSRPELDVDNLPAEEQGGPCEVCQQGAARHATALLTLRGPKYDRRSLKDLLPAEDSSAIEDSDSDSDNPSARKSRDKYYEFHSGISCTSRAEMYHQLRHWAYTTRNRVEDMLAPYRKPIKVPKLTSEMTKAERREARQVAAERKNEEANRLSKLLDEQGVIDEFVDRLQRELDVIIKSIAK